MRSDQRQATEPSSAELGTDDPPLIAQPRRRRFRHWLLGAGGLLLIGLSVLVSALLGAFTPAITEPTPVAPPLVVAPSPPSPARATPSPSPEPAAESPAETRVEISSTKPMAFSPVWDPPDSGQSFWQLVDPEYGYPSDGGTHFVLAHACASGNCAGDEFLKLHQGDTLTYLGETYEVEERRAVWKSEIAQQDIWHHDPDRIVLITCIIEVAGVRAQQNDIIIATRV